MMNRTTFLAGMCCLVTAWPSPYRVFADGDNDLGVPTTAIAPGTALISAGVGLSEAGNQGSGTITVAVPEDVTVEQVLLYWVGRPEADQSGGISLDDTATVNGIDIIGMEVGRETDARVESVAYRADITALGLVVPGVDNTIDITGLDGFGGLADGASVLVIVDDGTSQTDIQIRDGMDFAFSRCSTVLPGQPCRNTNPQTFTFAPDVVERTAELTLLVGDGKRARPDTIRITVGQTALPPICDSIVGGEGDEWDNLVIPVIVPAEVTSVTVQLASEACESDGTPDSLGWALAALALPELETGPKVSVETPEATCASEEILVKVFLSADASFTFFKLTLGYDRQCLTFAAPDGIITDGRDVLRTARMPVAVTEQDVADSDEIPLVFSNPEGGPVVVPGESEEIFSLRFAPGVACQCGLCALRILEVEASDGEEPLRVRTEDGGVQFPGDSDPPVIACPLFVMVLCAGPDGTTVDTPLPTAADLCDPLPQVDCEPAPGSQFPVGETTVECTATDEAGNTSSCSYPVIVRTDSTLVCPEGPSRVECTSSNGAVVYYPIVIRENCEGGAPQVECVPPSGSLLPPGEHQVSCALSGEAGAQSCEFTVLVEDTTPPSIACPDDVVVDCGGPSGTAVEYPPAVARDICDGEVAVEYDIPSGTVLPVGEHTVTCTATDSAGNSASCTFMITVGPDNTAPEINCPGDLAVSCASFVEGDEVAGATVEFEVTAEDLCDPSPTVICAPPSGSRFPVGETLVTCTASDASGNESSCTFTVSVGEDVTPPMIVCPPDITVEEAAGGVVEFVVTATDDCDAEPVVVCTPPSGSRFELGPTTVSCTATDAAGNASSCSFTVFVESVAPETTPGGDDDGCCSIVPIFGASRGGPLDWILLYALIAAALAVSGLTMELVLRRRWLTG